MASRGLQLFLVTATVICTLIFSHALVNSGHDSYSPHFPSSFPPEWVIKHNLDSFFNVSSIQSKRPLIPRGRSHSGSSLFFDPKKLPSVYTVYSLPTSITIVEWKQPTSKSNFKLEVAPGTCENPFDWGQVISPIPNDPAFPPGATSREWDLICRPEHYHPPNPSTPVLRIEQGYVEGGPGYEPRHEYVYGGVFNHHVSLQLERWVMDADLWFRPPSVPQHFKGRKIRSYKCLASVTGTSYASEFGHFPLQIFPRIVRLLALTPTDCPLLVSAMDATIVKKSLVLLTASGILQGRKVIHQEQSVLYYADFLYFADGPAITPPNSLLLNRFVTSVVGGPWEPTTVVYLTREPGPRSLDPENENALLRIMRTEFGQSVVIFKPDKDLANDVKVFGQAGLVVGPHGAGFANILFCPQSAVLLEIGYDGFFPDYYMRLAAALNLGYHSLIAGGNYSTTLDVDLEAFRTVFSAALSDTGLPRQTP